MYSIFGSKVELFLEVLLPNWHVPSGDELPIDAQDLDTFLEAYARYWVAGLRANDARRAFELELELYLAALREPRLLAKTRTIFEASHRQLTQDLERVSASGPPLSVPCAELARMLVAVLQGLSQMAATAGEEPDEEMFVRAALRLGSETTRVSPNRRK